jgi:branched-chain amino acid aminotransferase
MKLATDLNIPVVEELITRDLFYIADEVLITGTAAEIVGVRMIDFRQVGEGKIGPITRAVSDSYRDTIIGKGLRSEE